MWAYNVARQLARAAGYRVTPDKALQRDADMLAAADAWMQAAADDTYCILKVHMPLYERDGLKVIYLQRDLHDRIHSICRFDQRGFSEDSITQIVRSQLEMDAHYDRWQAHHLLRLPYAGLENDSRTLIRRIAGFMQLDDIATASIEQIDRDLSKQSVRRLVERLDPEAVDPASSVATLIRGSADAVRAFDQETGFQTGHVSDYRSGDWQHLWTDEQKEIVARAIRRAGGEP